MKVRIALDLDDTIFDFWNSYLDRFGNPKSDFEVTKNVNLKLRKDRDFWSNLPLIEKPNFIPTIYSTKRVSSKVYTRNNLKKYNLPIRPIYQTIIQSHNKVDKIKGVANLLIDDSPFNVMQALNVGFPAMLIDRPHNQEYGGLPRTYTLDIEEILDVYNLLITMNPNKFYKYV